MTDVTDVNDMQVDYTVLTPNEHVLERPDMYVGTTAVQELTKHVIVSVGDAHRVEQVVASCSPALLKLLDEVISNAQDHQKRDSGVTNIAIEIDKLTGLIQVFNNGHSTVPTRPFAEGSDKSVAETIFGTLLSGSNFNDAESRTQIGRNGLGVKLANIYSERFEINLVDPEQKVEYFQRWENNMKICHPPKVKKSIKKRASTNVTFLPDYKRLNMTVPLDDNVFLLLKSRVQDVAITIPTKVRVAFNGEIVSESSPKQLASCFGGDIFANDKINGNNGSMLEVCVVHTPNAPSSFSYVNGTRCKGTVYDLVFRKLSEAVGAKFPQASRITSILKDNLSLVVNATVVNPTFTSQTKEVLNLPPSKLGFDYTVSNSLLKKLTDAFKTTIELSMEKKSDKESSKAIKAKNHLIANFQRPLKLGKKPCTLFVCEGKSAQQMIVAGFRKIGRDLYGVYPLKGKILNTMNKDVNDAVKNTEILDLIHILNLDPKKEYDPDSIRKLPFHNVIILTDQDFDGFHICGLLTVFFQRFFPSLLQHRPTFLRRFFTPIVKAKDPVNKQLKSFFSMQTFKEWQAVHKSKECNYYKGLGTSSDREAIEYFSNLDLHTADFVFESEACHNRLTQWFCDKRADERKLMLRNINHEGCVDYAKSVITVSEFCDNELVHWSYANVCRTIPGLDGMKPSHRKVMHTLLQDKKPKPIKVAELAAKTIGFANYHSGEASLQETISHMQQDYIGTNQIVLLEGLSQFGSRDEDTKTHAAPRYAKTQIHTMARLMMVSAEDDVLDRVEDDGKICEPKQYATVLPMAILNGCEGIGTGYSTKIPEYSAKEVLIRCKHIALNDGKEFPPLKPCPHDFKGQVVEDDSCHFVYHGIVDVATLDGKQVLQISELPPGMWTNPTKDHIEKWAWVKQVDVVSTGVDVDIRIQVGDDKTCEEHLPEVKKYICKKVNTTNMYLFDSNGTLTKFETPEEIIAAHARYKLEVCQRRLDNAIKNIETDIRMASAKARYIQLILTGQIKIVGIKSNTLTELIKEHGLDEFSSTLKQMLLWNVTEEDSNALHEKVYQLEDQLNNLRCKTAHSIWHDDICKLEEFMFPQGTKRGREDLDD